MKTLALITHKINSQQAHWQFDKVMAAIAYDLDLSIVFAYDGLSQLQHSKMWLSLELYGVDKIYHLGNNIIMPDTVLKSKNISLNDLKRHIKAAELIL